MKRILIFIFLILSLQSFGQNPTNYTRIASRYRWISGMFDSTLYVPRYNGTPSGVRVNETSVIDGMIAMDTTNNRLYIYSGGAWVRLANYSEIGSTPTWPQTLNAGATFDQSYTANGAGFDFKLYSAAGNILFNTKANSTSYGSRLYLNGDSVWYIGNNKAYVKTNGVGNKLHIVAGQTSSDTTTYKPLAAQSSDGETVLMTYWPGGGGGGGVTSLAAIGSSPNANGATISGSVLNLEPASGSFGGVVTTGTQTFAGAKTFNDYITISAGYAKLTLDATPGTYGVIAMDDEAGNINQIYSSTGLTYNVPYSSYKHTFYNNGQITLQMENGSGLSTTGAISTTTAQIHSSYTGTDGADKGAFHLERTINAGATGNNHHGFVSKTTFKTGGASFNDFYAQSVIGRNTDAQGHWSGFQTRITKDSSNTVDDLYDFVALGSLINGGTATNRKIFSAFDADTSTGGILTNQWGVYIPTLTNANNNYGAYFGSNVGIGTATPSTPLHIINTTEQARIGYDASNYYKTTVGSTGGVTFDAVGSGANFTFSDAVTLGNLPSGAVSDSVLTDASGAVRHRKVSDLISPYVTTGTYTPTLSNTTNVSASTAYQCQYSVAADASGNQVVTVSGEVDIDPTTTVTLTVLRVTLPITSNVGQTYEIGGTANDELGTPARISGNVANDVAEIRFTPVDVTNRTFSFVFVYKVNIP